MKNTELDLQQSIKDVLENEIVSHLSVFKQGEMKVYLQDIPIDTQYEEDDEKYFPCCIVKLRGGKIEDASDPQTTTIEVVVIIKSWETDMSGYKNLMLVLNRIRDYFLAHMGIEGRYRLAPPSNTNPVKWVVNEEAAIPYFVGSITTKWITAVMNYTDPLGLL